MTSKNEPKKDAPVETEAAKHAQTVMDEEAKKGFRGVEVDDTPNSAYTVAGVVAGEPTPETDVELSRKRRAELDERSGRF